MVESTEKIISLVLVLSVVYLLAYFFIISPLLYETAVRNNNTQTKTQARIGWGKILNPENHTILVNGGQADIAKEGDNISITWNPTKI